MFVLEKDHKWVERHAEQRKDGVWVCKATHARIRCTEIGRSLWIKPFDGGFGEVRPVGHLWCPDCGEKPHIKYGMPIYEDELVEVEVERDAIRNTRKD